VLPLRGLSEKADRDYPEKGGTGGKVEKKELGEGLRTGSVQSFPVSIFKKMEKK